MERLKHIKDALVACVEGQVGNLQNVDAEELGEVVDMVKDMEEAIYYCTITKAMEESEKKEKYTEHHYYTQMMPWNRDMDKEYYGRMYYSGQPRDEMGRFMEDGRRNYNGSPSNGGSSNSGSSGANGNYARSYYTEREMPTDWRDAREGRSPMSRRMYMESKEMHKDKAAKIKDLENYMKELSEDVVEMIQGASPEEKQILEKKIAALANKVATIN